MGEIKTTTQIVPLKMVTYEQFKEFLDSLDEERETWSLDLQHHFKNDKEFYESNIYAIVCVHGKEMIGLCNAYSHINLPAIEVSFVVKKDYQSQGIGTVLLERLEWDQKKYPYNVKYVTAKHYKDNIASHKAFLKAGYKEWTFDKILSGDGGAWDWKIKEIG